ncbi:MAG TPA: flagellar hook capping FlgD N-terminal domain-containing protein [Caulobacteraceae bacterium]|jgi:flagellar basal-body rod modification protein FlgD|nr:flagellar hook capping FlgD N-terminal domain-containing protein [Caulobacteraceae bacterium]
MTVSAPTTATTGATNTAANNGLAQLADNYQTFLSLLTTQLKNQDPLSPLDTNQFTQQLTQMTGVEQQLLSNQLLQQLVTQSQGGGLTGAVGLIGKTVSASDTTATLQNGAATWQFSTASQPANMTATVTDSSGNVIWTGGLTPNGSGAQSFTWNGQNQSGVQQSNGGTYSLSINATDATGATIPVSTNISGQATAVQQLNGTTMVTVAGVQVPLSSVTAVN